VPIPDGLSYGRSRSGIVDLSNFSGGYLFAEVDDQLETEGIRGTVERVEAWGNTTGF
jgi:hypothetical protein